MVRGVSFNGGEPSLLDSVLEVCTAGVAVLDSDGAVIGADATFARLTGRERRLVRGMNVSELFRSDPPVALYDEDACALGWQGHIAKLRPLRGRTRRRRDRARASPPKSPQHQLRNVLTVIAGNVEIIGA